MQSNHPEAIGAIFVLIAALLIINLAVRLNRARSARARSDAYRNCRTEADFARRWHELNGGTLNKHVGGGRMCDWVGTLPAGSHKGQTAACEMGFGDKLFEDYGQAEYYGQKLNLLPCVIQIVITDRHEKGYQDLTWLISTRSKDNPMAIIRIP